MCLCLWSEVGNDIFGGHVDSERKLDTESVLLKSALGLHMAVAALEARHDSAIDDRH